MLTKASSDKTGAQWFYSWSIWSREDQRWKAQLQLARAGVQCSVIVWRLFLGVEKGSAGLWERDPPAFVCQVLGVQVWATMAGQCRFTRWESPIVQKHLHYVLGLDVILMLSVLSTKSKQGGMENILGDCLNTKPGSRKAKVASWEFSNVTPFSPFLYWVWYCPQQTFLSAKWICYEKHMSHGRLWPTSAISAMLLEIG